MLGSTTRQTSDLACAIAIASIAMPSTGSFVSPYAMVQFWPMDHGRQIDDGLDASQRATCPQVFISNDVTVIGCHASMEKLENRSRNFGLTSLCWRKLRKWKKELLKKPSFPIHQASDLARIFHESLTFLRQSRRAFLTSTLAKLPPVRKCCPITP